MLQSAMHTVCEDIPVAEAMAPVLQIYADCVSRVEIITPGINMRIAYCEFREIAGVWHRVPVVEIVRPIALFIPGRMGALVERARSGYMSGAN